MTVGTSDKYCTVYPSLDEADLELAIEACNDLQAFERCVTRLCERHNSKLDRLRVDWDEEEQEMEVGLAIVVKNRWGSALHVGVSDSGWLLIRVQPPPARILRANSLRRGEVAFLMPDWTEFERSILFFKDVALGMVKEWLDTGSLPDEKVEAREAEEAREEAPRSELS